MSVTDVEEAVDIPPPDLGLDTQAVLLDLGYSEERLAELADRGVIPSS
jgi:crotonobetainyl-CoA:carnitine CoA-transferase CaiB-like acyl-CoA transferase